MANYEKLKAAIQSVVKTNGNNEITGALLQQSLLAMINSLGSGYQFVDVATSATKPGTPDQKVFYIANGKGTYPNFSGISITEDEVVILYYDTDWHKLLTGIASNEKLSELEKQVIYDVTVNNDGATFTSLSELLSSENLSTFIPVAVRCGGMSIRFVQTPHKYVQARLMAQNFTTDTTQWQVVDDEPTYGSNNLIKSGGVSEVITPIVGGLYQKLNNDSCTIQGSVINNQGKADVVTGASYYHSDYIDISDIYKLTLIAPTNANNWGAALYSIQDESSFIKFIPYTTELAEYYTDGAKYLRFSSVDGSWFGNVSISLYGLGEIENCKQEIIYTNNEVNEIQKFLNKGYVSHNKWNIGDYIKLDGSIGSSGSNTVAVTDFLSIKNVIYVGAIAHGWVYANHLDYAFYDSDKIFISGGKYNSTSEVSQELNIPDGAVYVRISSQRNDAIYTNDAVITKYRNERTTIQIGGVGGYGFSEGMNIALSRRNCDVIIKPGVYDLSEEIPSLYNQNHDGIKLGGNNKYLFEAGSKVIFNYTGSDTNIISTFSPFVAENISPNNGNMDYEIDGLYLECTNLRYCIHDEDGGANAAEYKHIYKNCVLKGHNLSLNACIGGGLGYKAYVEIEGCYFISDGESESDYPRDVFYHGQFLATLAPDARYRLFIKNNYFNDGFTLNAPNYENEKNYCLYIGNSAARDIVYNSAYWEVYKGVNEIRNSNS